jgi:hypothetical protein
MIDNHCFPRMCRYLHAIGFFFLFFLNDELFTLLLNDWVRLITFPFPGVGVDGGADGVSARGLP